MKLSRNKISLLTISSILSFIPISTFVISCSSKSISHSNLELEQLVEEQKIVVGIKSSIKMSKKIFAQYQTNLKEMNKILEIQKNETNYETAVELLSSPTYDESKKKLNFNIKLVNLSKQNEEYIFNKSFDFNFSTDKEFITNAAKEINQSIELKKEFKNERIIDLFRKTKTNEDFINQYIDINKALENVIGLTFKLKIPTQTTSIIRNVPFIKFTYDLFNQDVKLESPTGAIGTPQLKVDNENLKDTFTIIDYKDLGNKNLNLFSELGEMFIRIDQANQIIDLIEINYDFSNKGIINTLDLSMFKEVIFNSKFGSNLINQIKFNKEGIVRNLVSGTFSGNILSVIELPKVVINYDANCFDSNVKVVGITSIENFNNYYRDQNLYLDKIQTKEELENVLKIISKSQNKLEFNDVYLPTFSILSTLNINFLNDYSLTCNKIIFHNENFNYEFKWRLSSWVIKEIYIPNYIIQISQFNLPLNAQINRDSNIEIKKLINNDTFNYRNIDINVNGLSKKLWSINIFDVLSKEDLNNISTIIFDEDLKDSIIPNLNNDLFNNKNIVFTSTTNRINPIFYRMIKQKAKSIQRNSALTNDILNNNKQLNLFNFYAKYNINNNQNINEFLVGYEDQITTINMDKISKIFNSTFAELDWPGITISLNSNIQEIESKAFQNSKIKIEHNNFSPINIGDWAFANSTIGGNLNLDKLEKLGAYSFYCSKVEQINFSNKIQIIPRYAFYLCNNLIDINLSNIVNISEYAFYSCTKLKNVDLTKTNEIGSFAFSSCTSLTLINLSNVIKLGSFAFSDCLNLDNINSIATANQIGDKVFYGCTKITTSISFKNDAILGNEIFNNCSSLTTINNFNFDKYDIYTNLFGSSINLIKNKIQINQQISNEEIYKAIGYNASTGILDMSLEKFENKKTINYLYLFFKNINHDFILNELVLPNQNTINDLFNKLLSNNITIKKVTWNSNVKLMSKSLSNTFNRAKILSLDENFFQGMNTIPANVIDDQYKTLNVNVFNLENVVNVRSRAFVNLEKSVQFKNTSYVKVIESRAFNSNCSFEIGVDVQLQEDSFNSQNVVNNPDFKIRRAKITSKNIYIQNTRTLDFSFVLEKDLIKYQNLNKYFLNGDVKHLILPKLFRLPADYFNDLGIVETIEFQQRNQVILENAFKGTTILNKPRQSQTHILLDLDNFFSA